MTDFHPYWLIVISTLLALLPLAIIAITPFLKVSIVLGMLRSGLGISGVPSTIAEMTLCMILTLFIVQNEIPKTERFVELLSKQNFKQMQFSEIQTIGQSMLGPLKDFLQSHTGKYERKILQSLKENKNSSSDEGEISIPQLVLGFMLTELKSAFFMGFVVLLPFLAIDLIVANILGALGLYSLSPQTISLPIKVILFTAANGWSAVAQGLVLSYDR